MVNGLSVTLSPPANAAPSSVAVAPSSTAQFAYQYSDVPTGSRDELSHLRDGRRHAARGNHVLVASFALSIAPCNNGTIRVSPVYPTS